MSRNPLFLIGFGQDVHRLIAIKNETEQLVLGGVPFSCGLKFEANSDGDIILHALCNALATALGEGSFSTVADSLCQSGITNSQAYVEVYLKKMQERGYHVNNISISVEGLQPKLEAYNQTIRKALAHLLKIESRFVGLALTTGENLTACGKGEGMSALVTVLLEHD